MGSVAVPEGSRPGAFGTSGLDDALFAGFSVRYDFPVLFRRNVLAPEDPTLAGVFQRAGAGPHRVVALVDQGVLDARPEVAGRLQRYAHAWRTTLELVCDPVGVAGGEGCKTGWHAVSAFYRLVERHRLCRQSFVLGVGGGAVLDAVGYGAATAHRGIRLVRMPTTVLSQCDSGVGVKNAVNEAGRKNFVGTFAPPFAVVNDFSFLESLPPRELRAGIAEAVKVALVRDGAFFADLHAARHRLAAFEPSSLEWLIRRCAAHHLAHICGGDPFERTSARPLDFGHWSAHKLEERTGGSMGHGEAVALGIVLDAAYCHRLGWLTGEQRRAIVECLGDVGFALFHPALAELDVEGALEDFRAHLGGRLTVTLLRGLGHGTDVHEIDVGLMRECAAGLAREGSPLS